MRLIKLTALLFTTLYFGSAQAVLRVEITDGVSGALPVAMVPFKWKGEGEAPSTDIASIISQDLALTGRFAPISRDDMLEMPGSVDEMNFQNWRILGVDNVLVGYVRPTGGGKYMLEYQLLDVFSEKRLFSFAMPVARDKLRAAAHFIADQFYEKITGEKGAFNTKIAYVAVQKVRGQILYRLNIADSDGANAQIVFEDIEPIMSPTWSPLGDKLAYVSFKGGHVGIYTHELATGSVKKISGRDGINGAPAWSPSGQYIAMTLSSGSNVDVYLYEVATARVQRITRNPSIDTEPSWSPDSEQLVFTSNRGGSPQIYSYDMKTRNIERLTFEGEENARPRFSPDGSKIAVVTRERGKYRIALFDIATRSLQVLSRGSLDESPSFSPNGAIIIYSNNDGAKAELAAVSVDGKVRQRLTGEVGEVREPVWGPYIQ